MTPSDLPENLKPGMAVEVKGKNGTVLLCRFKYDFLSREFFEQDSVGLFLEDLQSITPLVPEKPKCRWKYDEFHDAWDGTCGVKYCFIAGTPQDNKMKFCPQCGGPLEQTVSEIITEEE